MSNIFSKLTCRLENGIMWFTVNRPEMLNALNEEVFMELGEAFKMIKSDPEVKVVVITGSGDRAFIAGADIGMMDQLSFLEVKQTSVVVFNTQQSIANCPKPTIAAINGVAFGGGLELALCCDLRVASEKAKLGLLETNLGIIPGGGGTQRLARQVGMGRAKEMIFSGLPITAQRAYEMGLVNLVVSHDQLTAATNKLAQKMAEKSSISLAFAKQAMDMGFDMDLETGLKVESEFFAQCFVTHDGKEGLRAYMEKRKPHFIGK